MLKLTVVTEEGFDEAKYEFVPSGEFVLELEHSLVSLSKWESNFEKPFLSSSEKTSEEMLWYLSAMVISSEVPPDIFTKMTEEHYTQINRYINAKMTATWFAENGPQKKSRKVVTAELIYYWMFTLGIPKECEHWHLNQLMTLIQVFNQENKPAKKMSPRQIAQQQKSLNDQRRAQLGTRG